MESVGRCVQLSMDSEDDICVLPQSPKDEVDAFTHPDQHIILFSPLSPVPDFDRGSHQALQKAYSEVKRRLNESNAKNQVLSKRVWELESTRSSSSFIGDSYDMMDDARGQGAAEAQMAAEEGYSKNLQRQLARAKDQIVAMEKKYQETVQEMKKQQDSLSQQLQEAKSQLVLSQEKLALQQSSNAVLREKEELRRKCESLEIERDKAIKEGAALHLSLQKAEQEVAMLKENQGDSLPNEPSPELVAELACMRKIIDSLKKMVLAQRDCLARRGMSMSMQSSMSRSVRDPSSVESDTTPPGSSRTGGSHSGQSWEMLNGISPPTLDPHQQQQQQQQQQLMVMQQRSVASASSTLSPKAGHQDTVAKLAVPQKQMVNGGMGTGRIPAATSQMESALPGQKSRTEIIQRKKSEDNDTLPKSRTEVIRSPQCPRLAEYMGSHYHQQLQQVGVGTSSQPAQTGLMQPQQGSVGLIQPQQGSVGLNQLQQQEYKRGLSEPAQGLTSQTRAPHYLAMQYPPSPYSPQRQVSPAREPASTYDNLTVSQNNNNDISTVPTVHVLNQGGLTGARLVQSNSDSFGSSGGSTMTLAPQQPGLAAAIRRDGGLARGLPQEHTDITQPPDHHHLNLNDQQQQPVEFEKRLPAGESRTGLDRKCPVCGQDFSHISMDEFQTHVFECFDDAEDSNAPETLQPQRTTKQNSESANRICPMCEKQFPENVTQQFFEAHVQSHFEEIDPFEVLHPPQM